MTGGFMKNSSLENSYTNIFALTELAEIQFKKYIIRPNYLEKCITTDPVLNSFYKCQSEGFLCAWIRAKKENTNTNRSYIFSEFARELYVFWYDQKSFTNEEKLISPDLVVSNFGNWKAGISYEVRIVLFKAIHNLIERSLINKDFVRIGKWFINVSRCDLSKIGANFSFFLHGDCTVCTSIDIKRLPSLINVRECHLDFCQKSNKGIPVVISPFGICAHLIGRANDNDLGDVHYKNWIRFYSYYMNINQGDCSPSFHNNQNLNDDRKNEFVSLLIGGIFKLSYPMKLVFICIDDIDKSLLSSGFIPVGLPRNSSTANISSLTLEEKFLSDKDSCKFQREKYKITNPQVHSSTRDKFIKLDKSFSIKGARLMVESHNTAIRGKKYIKRNYLTDKQIKEALKFMAKFTKDNRSIIFGELNSPSKSTQFKDGSCSKTFQNKSIRKDKIHSFVYHRRNELNFNQNFLRPTMTNIDFNYRSNLKTSSSMLSNTDDPLMPTLSPQQPTIFNKTEIHTTHAQIKRAECKYPELNVCDNKEPIDNCSSFKLYSSVFAPNSSGKLEGISLNFTFSNDPSDPSILIPHKNGFNKNRNSAISRFTSTKYDLLEEFKFSEGIHNKFLNVIEACYNSVSYPYLNAKSPCCNICVSSTSWNASSTTLTSVQPDLPRVTESNFQNEVFDPSMLNFYSVIHDCGEFNFSYDEDNNRESSGEKIYSNFETNHWSFVHPRTVMEKSVSSDFSPNDLRIPNTIMGRIKKGSRTHKNSTSSSIYSKCISTDQSLLIKPMPPRFSPMHESNNFKCSSINDNINELHCIEFEKDVLAVSRKKGLFSDIEAQCSSANLQLLSLVYQALGRFSCLAINESLYQYVVDPFTLHVILQDSSINMFKDHNFESCTICVCTCSAWSREVGLYLPPPTKDWNISNTSSQTNNVNSVSADISNFDPFLNEALYLSNMNYNQSDCRCGFSATVNQRLGSNANLFFEDEVEVTAANLVSAISKDQAYDIFIKSSLINQCIFRPAKLIDLMTQTNDACGYTPLLTPYTMMPLKKYRKFASYSVNSEKLTMNEIVLRNLKILCRWIRSPLYELSANSLFQNIEYENIILGPRKMDENILEFNETCALILATLPQCIDKPLDQIGMNKPELLKTIDGIFVHPGFVLKSSTVTQYDENDHLTLLNMLKPLLQEALSSTRPLATMAQVDGPLTWKAFHQLAENDNEEICAPEPIPEFKYLSKDQKFINMPPFSLRIWNNLCLSPISKRKKLFFMVIAPNDKLLQNDSCENHYRNHLFSNIANYFRDLSITYESCLLGSHSPCTGILETSILMINLSVILSMDELSDENQYLIQQMQKEESVTQESSSNDSEIQNFYLFVFNYINEMKLKVEKFLKEIVNKLCSSNSNPSQIPTNGKGNLTTSLDFMCENNEMDPYLVVYFIEPFSIMSHSSLVRNRNIINSILHWGFSSIIECLSDFWKNRLNLEILPLNDFVSFSCLSEWNSNLNSTALYLYERVDLHVNPSLINANQTLTGFGPSSEQEELSCALPKSVFAPAYVLHTRKDYHIQTKYNQKEILDRSNILYVAYCLSDDRNWLLSVSSDESGQMINETVINLNLGDIQSPVYSRMTRSLETNNSSFSLRRYALAKLWDFIISIVASTCHSWRLVVSRIGRLGHGELKAWNSLLNRANLQDVNNAFHDNCVMCNLVSKPQSRDPNNLVFTNNHQETQNITSLTTEETYANSCRNQVPSLISGCLVSIEPQSTFKIFHDRDGMEFYSNQLNKVAIRSCLAHNNKTTHSLSTSVNNVSANPLATNQHLTCNSHASTLAYSLQSQHIYARSRPSLVGPWSLPSSTHVLVFPTSTTASAQQEAEIDPDYLRCEEELLNDMNFMMDFDSLEFATVPTDESCVINKPNRVSPSNSRKLNALSSTSTDNRLSGFDNSCWFSTPINNQELQLINSTRYHSRMVNERNNLIHLLDILSKLDEKNQDPCVIWKILAEFSERHFTGQITQLPFGVPDPQDSDFALNLMIQPIAMGYYLSSAPADSLPRWFWSSCPHKQWQLPVCLKSSLHIKYSLVMDRDETVTGSASLNELSGHPLDSNTTCDVLRFILESFNSLSWLNMDPLLNDRSSCLPVHIYQLSRMCLIVDQHLF